MNRFKLYQTTTQFRSSLLLLLTLSITITFLITSCEEEVVPDLPIVLTGEIVQNSENGVLLNGKIVFKDSRKIDDYGFIWSNEGIIPTIENGYKKSFGVGQEGVFSTSVTQALIKGEKYNVKAYAKVGDVVVYGKTVSFESRGSKLPEIIDLSPNVGLWGDSVRLKIRNISQIQTENSVFFGDSKADILDYNDSTFLVLVPNDLDSASVSVYLKTLGIRSIGASFSLTPPTISSVEPAVAYPNQFVQIYGANYKPLITKVYVGDSEISSLVVSNNRIDLNLPESFAVGKYPIAVSVGGSERVFWEKELEVSITKILDIKPSLSTWGDTVVVFGPDFTTSLGSFSSDGIYFDDFKAKIISKDSASVKVIVPDSIDNINPIVKAKRFNTEVSFNNFYLKRPVIKDISPALIFTGDIVTISGENFHPSFNQVLGLSAITLFSESTFIELDTRITTEEGQINVQVSANGILSDPFPIEVISEWSEILPFAGGRRYKAHLLDIGGEIFVSNGVKDIDFFAHVPIEVRAIDMYKFNSSNEDWIKVASPPGESRNFFTTKNYGYSIVEDVLWRYDPSTDIWDKQDPVPTTSFFMISFSINDKGYLMTDTEFWEYDEQTNSWSQKNPSGIDIYGELLEFNGKGIYVTNNKIYEYDPNMDSWLSLLDLPVERNGFSLVRYDNKFYIIAGYTTYDNQGQNGDNRIFEFDPLSNSITELKNGPFNGRHEGVGFSINGKIYYGTGNESGIIYGSGGFLSDFWSWDPKLSN